MKLTHSAARIIRLLIIFICTVLFAKMTFAEVECSCETIDAEGRGNSSCSANESGGKCTIDYNLFGDREVRAAKILEELLAESDISLEFTPTPELNTVQSLTSAINNKLLPEKILLYMLVATFDQFEKYPDSVNTKSFEQFYKIVFENQSELYKAFDQRSDERVVKNGGEYVISHGCIEAKADGVSAMFKAHWSAFAQNPRCGGG